ncbi:hypothetical protein IscW_ISCW008749 [Ixodes scapularis]|uniref:Uncharacterized protein n=1 Tax=Ixodes scapularis TaxID=6945 RepID=B7PYW4_IXOSC|nr:hypothetical protein IscW_ISCW008749 [Ixodes scapularis]|eukprot:XP_002404084.1 hypothetical protein IscW_ISCW008749 [Ixodes scapularis]
MPAADACPRVFIEFMEPSGATEGDMHAELDVMPPLPKDCGAYPGCMPMPAAML